MVNYGWIELGLLDDRLFPFGWDCSIVPPDRYITFYGHTLFYGPIWALVLAALLAAGLLWWLDRRAPAGCCAHCGYNLTGNVSGRCPECAHPCEKRASTSVATGLPSQSSRSDAL